MFAGVQGLTVVVQVRKSPARSVLVYTASPRIHRARQSRRRVLMTPMARQAKRRRAELQKREESRRREKQNKQPTTKLLRRTRVKLKVATRQKQLLLTSKHM